MRALGGVASYESLFEILPPLLESGDPGIAREAARQLRRLRYALSGDDRDRVLESSQAWTRRAGLSLATGRRGWDVPVAAVSLYDDPDPALREYARDALHMWLEGKAANAGYPSEQQAERLRTAIGHAGLSPERDRFLRFCAGLPRDD